MTFNKQVHNKLETAPISRGRPAAASGNGLTLLAFLWSDWRRGLAGAVALAAGAALISAWLTPRGPLTTPQALASMVAALAFGLASGLVMGNRWSLLVAPATFVVVFELARLGVAGPTVDAIHLGSTYGLIAFVLGRLVHGLLVLAPMVLGAALGVEVAARLGRDAAPTLGVAGWTLAALATLCLLALAFAIARPAATAPILGADGQPWPGSIAELTTVSLGGHDQALLIRGRSVDNPVLLYLAGGPGGTDLGAMRNDVALEQDFIVVTWEQRGAGKSYAALDPAETLTVEQMVADTLELTNYLRRRFDANKIYLAGNSWGALLGVLAVAEQPELFYAYVGAGQMVSPRATDVIFYEDTLAWADASDRADLAAQLRQNGPPPYANLLDYEPALAHEHDWNAYPEFDGRLEMPANLFVPENSLLDRVNGLRAFLDTFSVLYPQLQEIDFRRDISRLDVPVYLVSGAHEARGRALPAAEWFEMLQAPSKEHVTFPHAGHRPHFEDPAAFAALMNRVKEATYTD